jgi:hypothetical protein
MIDEAHTQTPILTPTHTHTYIYIYNVIILKKKVVIEGNHI